MKFKHQIFALIPVSWSQTRTANSTKKVELYSQNSLDEKNRNFRIKFLPHRICNNRVKFGIKFAKKKVTCPKWFICNARQTLTEVFGLRIVFRLFCETHAQNGILRGKTVVLLHIAVVMKFASEGEYARITVESINRIYGDLGVWNTFTVNTNL